MLSRQAKQEKQLQINFLLSRYTNIQVTEQKLLK